VLTPIRLDARNPGPMTGGGNNTYLLIGPAGSATLVDAGVGEPRHVADLESRLAAGVGRLDAVLVTHAHADHASGAPALGARHPGARFYKCPWPAADAAFEVRWEPIGEGDVVDAGGEQLAVLHTPGHSPDHVVFWHEPTRTCFTGDMVSQTSSMMIESSRGGDLIDYLRSLERLRDLDARRFLPAHGPAVANPSALLEQYVSHRMMRERQVIGALRAGRATVQAIADSIYDGLDPALMPAARENVRAHLEKLRKEGRAAEQDARWTI
jgi:hydroxyacylglutathione hydrolase